MFDTEKSSDRMTPNLISENNNLSKSPFWIISGTSSPNRFYFMYINYVEEVGSHDET